MQSFASPTHTNPPPHKNHAPQIKHHNSTTTFYTTPPQKGCNYHLSSRPFYPKIHRKGATIAYTHALSTQKPIERAQLSLVLAKNITIFAKKQINHNYYDKQRINRKSL